MSRAIYSAVHFVPNSASGEFLVIGVIIALGKDVRWIVLPGARHKVSQLWPQHLHLLGTALGLVREGVEENRNDIEKWLELEHDRQRGLIQYRAPCPMSVESAADGAKMLIGIFCPDDGQMAREQPIPLETRITAIMERLDMMHDQAAAERRRLDALVQKHDLLAHTVIALEVKAEENCALAVRVAALEANDTEITEPSLLDHRERLEKLEAGAAAPSPTNPLDAMKDKAPGWLLGDERSEDAIRRARGDATVVIPLAAARAENYRLRAWLESIQSLSADTLAADMAKKALAGEAAP